MFALQTASGVQLEMNEMAEGHSRCADQERPLPSSSSPLSSPSSTQIWLLAESPLSRMDGRRMDQDSPHHHVEMQSSPRSCFYEELFCTGRTSDVSLPLTGALMTSSGPQSDVVKRGHLGKLDRNRRRYFVLRAGSHTGPSRLEWYKNQEKFATVEKAAGKATLFASGKQGVIYLRCCLGVSRSGSSRKGHTVALYAKDQTMVLVAEDQWEQEDWYLAIKKLIEEERKDEEHGDGFDEEDDGYCTLPAAAFFKEVWPVTVKPVGLGCSKSLSGESRLCLTATSLILVRAAACSNLPSVTIPLLSVRRFGHLDGSFYLELGRSAPNGPGEIWMEARDQGNPAVAQQVHEVVRETVRALRALPDFSRSPTSNHSPHQTLQPLKRRRPKYRDKLVNVKPAASRLALPFRNPEIGTSPTKCNLEPHKPAKTEPESTLSSAAHVGSHQCSMEMKMDQHLPVNKGTGHHCSVAACEMESWEPGEDQDQDQDQGLGYMMMSPPGSHSSLVQPQDDYVTMASPNKHTYSSPSSSLQTSFNSSASDGCSPLHPSHHQPNEPSQPHWLVTSVQQSEAAKQRRGARTRASSSPVSSVDRLGVMAPFVACGPDCARPVQASPNSGKGRSHLAASGKSVRRYRLSSCLPSCLQAEDRD